MVDDALEEKLLGLFDLIDVLQEVEGLTRVLTIVVEIQFEPIKVGRFFLFNNLKRGNIIKRLDHVSIYSK